MFHLKRLLVFYNMYVFLGSSAIIVYKNKILKEAFLQLTDFVSKILGPVIDYRKTKKK